MYYSKRFKRFLTVKHCFFSKKGGFSKGLYRSLNCGKGSRDNKENVFKNLKLVAKRMKILRKNLVTMNQTHSSKVAIINRKNYQKNINSDAMITKIKGITLGVLTADCVPILVYDAQNKIVGCIHAGWKGAYSNIIKKTILKMRKLSSKTEIYAAIGPCIGLKNYEVDLKFFKKFLSKSKKNKKYFFKKNDQKMIFDLREFVADKLLELDVKIDHIKHDTFKEKDNFFSYRRSLILKEPDYGRCISVIRLV